MSKFLDQTGLAYYDGEQKNRLAKKADITSIPTKVSQVQNDSGFITSSDVPNNETDPTVPAWAKAANKPTYTAAEVGAIPAADADTFAKKADISTVYKYKGTLATVNDLPSTGSAVGDVWNVEETDMNYGWTGTAWDPLGQPFQIDSITNSEIDAIMNAE